MSASFPQVAFWVIFPLAALVVLSGWVMIIRSAIRKARLGKQKEGNERTDHPFQEHPTPLQPYWTQAEGIAPDGTPAVQLL